MALLWFGSTEEVYDIIHDQENSGCDIEKWNQPGKNIARGHSEGRVRLIQAVNTLLRSCFNTQSKWEQYSWKRATQLYKRFWFQIREVREISGQIGQAR